MKNTEQELFPETKNSQYGEGLSDGREGVGPPQGLPDPRTPEKSSGWAPAEESSHDRKYREWRGTEHGEEVYEKFRQLALMVKRKGWNNFGARALTERIRWNVMLKNGPDADGFKINNTHSVRLAKEVEMQEPELKGFFRYRNAKEEK